MMSYTILAGAMYLGHEMIKTASSLITALSPAPQRPLILPPPLQVEEDDYEGLLKVGRLMLDAQKKTSELQKAKIQLCAEACDNLEREILTYDKCKRMYEAKWIKWSTAFDKEEWMYRKNKAAHICRLRMKWFPETN